MKTERTLLLTPCRNHFDMQPKQTRIASLILKRNHIMNFNKTLRSSALIVAAFAGLANAAPAFTSWDSPPIYPIVDNRTRAEVVAETVAYLKATKGAFASGEAHLPDAQVLAQPTRAQVLAEIAESKRLGLITHGEATVFPTAEQTEQVRQAGMRAAHVLVSQGRN
jgi:hypothetical protein